MCKISIYHCCWSFQMEFFHELRSIVRKVEHGIKDVKEMVEGDKLNDDTDRHNLLLMLREKNTEMKDIKVCSLF